MLIVGCGGLALQMLDDLEEQLNSELVFWADIDLISPVIKKNYRVISSNEAVKKQLSQDKRFILGVGGCANRKNLAERFLNYGGELYSFISSRASISKYARIGIGTVVLQKAVIEADVIIGKGCLINTCAIITHECTIDEFTELAPLSLLSGKVKIGASTFIGAHSTVLPKINIGSNVIIGAKSLVTKHVTNNITVLGIPAKIFEK
jgi:sugar O-acyltransferase (sialic acid O-acetyltransferase NeuD family)